MSINKQEFTLDAINFWDREMDHKELLFFRYTELKRLIYNELGISPRINHSMRLCKLGLKHMN